jgi:AmiR/NasT family two-component response regulator
MSSNGAPIPSARVLQASGMVSVQAHCTPDEALVLMRARAAETLCTLEELAELVLDRSTRFGG